MKGRGWGAKRQAPAGGDLDGGEKPDYLLRFPYVHAALAAATAAVGLKPLNPIPINRIEGVAPWFPFNGNRDRRASKADLITD